MYHVLVHDHNRIYYISCTHVARSRDHGMSVYPHQQMVLYHQKLMVVCHQNMMVVPQQRKRSLLVQQIWCGRKSSELALEMPRLFRESYHLQEVFMASVDGHGVEVFVDRHLYAQCWDGFETSPYQFPGTLHKVFRGSTLIVTYYCAGEYKKPCTICPYNFI